ncbi:MAG: right-handed parallel beta-helix repeat-containing protein [Planctomycetaceae bacterium]|nr:right-handed parallel beta-helix repeat-containing protein [Planctomycetaceae bacterium]
MSNVRDFGATGDGTADDTQAIQHALADGDGEVVFPRGNYRVTRTLHVPLQKFGRTSLSGSGGVAKLIMDGPGACLAIEATHTGTADPASFREQQWQQERMPTVDGIEIEGRHKEADGILLRGVVQPTLTRVLIRRVRTALKVTGRARNVIVNGCHFYENSGVGIHLAQLNLHQVIIADSHISYCRLGGIRIEDSEIRNLQITGNDIEYNNYRAHKRQFPDAAGEPTAEIYIDVSTGSVREGTIASNTIQATYSPGGANIRFLGSGETGHEKAGMWTITGNLIGSQSNNIHLTRAYGVNITGNYIYSGHHRNLLVEDSRNIVVGSNSFGHNADYGNKALATGLRFVNCRNCNLTGVLIQDAPLGQHTVSGAVALQRDALVEIIDGQSFNISGCQILDGTPVGLRLENCSNSLVSGCSILDQRSERKMRRAIECRGGTGNLISNNRLSGRKADLPADRPGFTVSGNVFDS